MTHDILGKCNPYLAVNTVTSDSELNKIKHCCYLSGVQTMQCKYSIILLPRDSTNISGVPLSLDITITTEYWFANKEQFADGTIVCVMEIMNIKSWLALAN